MKLPDPIDGIELDLDRLTAVTGWRAFGLPGHEAQDEEHMARLKLVVALAREYAGLPPFGWPVDDLDQLSGRTLRDEVRQRKRKGEPVPVYYKPGDWEKQVAIDWSQPGNVRTKPTTKAGGVLRRPKRATLPASHNPSTGALESPETWGPPHPVYRNVPYYDGIVPVLTLVWWQRTEGQWKKKDRPPIGVSSVGDNRSTTNGGKGSRTGATPSHRSGPMVRLVEEAFRQASALQSTLSARQVERLVEELRDAEFPITPAPVGP